MPGYTYKFEDIAIVHDGKDTIVSGECEVEYTPQSEYSYSGKAIHFAEIVGFDYFEVTLCNIDGEIIADLKLKQCDDVAKLIIEKLDKDEDYIAQLCYEDYCP